MRRVGGGGEEREATGGQRLSGLEFLPEMGDLLGELLQVFGLPQKYSLVFVTVKS
jgi:hypothetical protein